MRLGAWRLRKAEQPSGLGVVPRFKPVDAVPLPSVDVELNRVGDLLRRETVDPEVHIHAEWTDMGIDRLGAILAHFTDLVGDEPVRFAVTRLFRRSARRV